MINIIDRVVYAVPKTYGPKLTPAYEFLLGFASARARASRSGAARARARCSAALGGGGGVRPAQPRHDCAPIHAAQLNEVRALRRGERHGGCQTVAAARCVVVATHQAAEWQRPRGAPRANVQSCVATGEPARGDGQSATQGCIVAQRQLVNQAGARIEGGEAGFTGAASVHAIVAIHFSRQREGGASSAN